MGDQRQQKVTVKVGRWGTVILGARPRRVCIQHSNTMLTSTVYTKARHKQS